jgi:methyl-accepting chemotaxis protein
MFKTMRMSLKLALLVGGMLLLAALIGLAGLYNMSLSRDRLDASLTFMHHLVDLNEELDGANIEFKSQVQEWNNLLIRGHDTKEYQNYLAGFHKQEKLVQERLEKVKASMQALALDGKSMDDLAKQHRELGARYMEALKTSWDANYDGSYLVVDKQIRGIDRKLSEDID